MRIGLEIPVTSTLELAMGHVILILDAMVRVMEIAFSAENMPYGLIDAGA